MKILLWALVLITLPTLGADIQKVAEVIKDCEARPDMIGAHPIILKQGAKHPVAEEKIGYVIITVGSNRIRVSSNQVRILAANEEKRERSPANMTEAQQGQHVGASEPAVSPAPTEDSTQTTQTDTQQAQPSTLAPQQNWWKRTGQEMVSCEELYKGLQPSTTSNSSLEISENPEIYKGVRLMMPLIEAVNILHLGTDLNDKNESANQEGKKMTITPISCLIPAKSPISHAGVPFFFRPFDLKKLPRMKRPTDGPDDFNLLYIITDAADRVVGIMFLCETPHSMETPNTDFLTFNFILNRKKITRDLKVRFELNSLNQSTLLVVDTWLIDDKKGKCLEIVRWYLPARIGNFIRHVLEIKLGLAPSVPPA